MSSHEGSDDDDDDENAEKPKKPIPEWARGPNLEAAIHAQYGPGAAVNPENLFGAVLSCELESIFQAKKKRYAKRTSSGIWTADALTAAELAKYRAELEAQPSKP
jgi:inner centromere protein